MKKINKNVTEISWHFSQSRYFGHDLKVLGPVSGTVEQQTQFSSNDYDWQDIYLQGAYEKRVEDLEKFAQDKNFWAATSVRDNEDIQYLEQKMNAKDNEIAKHLKRTKPNLSTEKPIPQMCKYIAYKNLTDKSRRHDFFNSSGDACDMVAAPESGCVKSSDWQGRGLYFFLYQ